MPKKKIRKFELKPEFKPKKPSGINFERLRTDLMSLTEKDILTDKSERVRENLLELMARVPGTTKGGHYWAGKGVYTDLETVAHLFEEAGIEPGSFYELGKQGQPTNFISFTETILPILNVARGEPLEGDKRKISASFRIYGHDLINTALKEYLKKSQKDGTLGPDIEVRLSYIRKKPTLIVRTKKRKGSK